MPPPNRDRLRAARAVRGEDGVWESSYTYDDETPAQRLVRLDLLFPDCPFYLEIDPRYSEQDVAEVVARWIARELPTIHGKIVGVEDPTPERMHLRFEAIGGTEEFLRAWKLRHESRAHKPIGFTAPAETVEAGRAARLREAQAINAAHDAEAVARKQKSKRAQQEQQHG